MSAPKRARDDESAGAAAGGAGAAGGTPPPPARRTRAAVAAARAPDPAYERRLKLTDVIGFVAQNGYAREADACAGLNRETWRCIPAGLSAADADRVRRDHPLWQAIIDLKHGKWKETRLMLAARKGDLARVRELCDWRAGVEEVDTNGRMPLLGASSYGHLDVVRELLVRGASIEAASNDSWTSLLAASDWGYLDVVRELLARGANIEAANINGATSLYLASQNGYLVIVCELLSRGANVNVANGGDTPLIMASYLGHVDVVRALLTAGADKHHVGDHGDTATSRAGGGHGVKSAAKAAVLALLAAAP
jgi:hypothetical protein